MLRRTLVAVVAIATVAVALVPAPVGAAAFRFPNGVASYATHDQAILWARVDRARTVKYQVSKAKDFAKVVKKGEATAAAGDDFIVQPTVSGLNPGTKYFFRFLSGDAVSRGRFRTLPDPARAPSFDFSVSADSDVLWKDHPSPQDEPFALLRRIKETNPDFFIYLGDTIYSDSETVVGGVPVDPALTLEEKWAKYRANRVAATKALLKSVSTWAQWDDHEFINDFDGAVLSQTDPDLFEAGMEAFFDYFPIPDGPTYRKIDVGSEADFFMLDERSFRTQSPDEEDSPCRDAEGDLDLAPQLPANYRDLFLDLGPTDPECLSHLADPTRTMLGLEQKTWLKENLLTSDATWKFIINEVPMVQLFGLPYDRWEGYEAERTELLNFIRDNDIQNVVFLTTDIHANWAGPLYVDITDDNPRAAAYEVTSGPIQTCNLQCEFDAILGEGSTDQLFNAFKFYRLIDFDCVHYKTYAYVTVTTPSDPASPLEMEWRNQKKATGGGGKLVPDLQKAGDFCVEELAPGVYPE